MDANASLSANMEDYLEVIYWLIQRSQVARVKDIAEKLRVSMPSVTAALKTLSAKGLVNYDRYQYITLTEEGRDLAREVVRHHEVLTDFLIRVLHLPPDEAEENACRMEHAVGEKVLERFVQFLDFVETCPRGGPEWLDSFARFCAVNRTAENCDRCIQACLESIRKKRQAQEKPPISLGALKVGQRAVVDHVDGPLSKRIADMGVTPGTVVEVERVAPLGDPIDIKVKGYHLSVRRREAAEIAVRLV